MYADIYEEEDYNLGDYGLDFSPSGPSGGAEDGCEEAPGPEEATVTSRAECSHMEATPHVDAAAVQEKVAALWILLPLAPGAEGAGVVPVPVRRLPPSGRCSPPPYHSGARR